MTREEFIAKYEQDKPMLDAWAKFIIAEIRKHLPEGFEQHSVKIPVSHRIKDNQSILEKVFIRKMDKYKNPYEDVQDKVGLRWVVLLTEQLKTFCKIIENSEYWSFSKDRTLNDWEEKPEVFSYQSIHYILIAKQQLVYENTEIKIGTPCEVQLRTLLQHTYSEFGHDTIYKGNLNKPPEVLRYLAKSMALLETTDELLCNAKERIEKINYQDPSYPLIKKSNEIFKSYFNFTENQILDSEKTACFILNKIRSVIDENKNFSEDNFNNFLESRKFILERIKDKKSYFIEFSQPIILLIYFLVSKNRRRKDWHPFSDNIMEKIYTDLGYSYAQD
ncbi:(p)ppGpp synthetase [Aggregatibacter actinomycetemcomitans]|uniref:GTP pyrophosphokinase n=1 Tax=Aggregatibacter actinomycetemcomitans TaxID=714 RepID=UPI00022AD580|nr:RelA/SpoT domain-containing protein [Aggregatibacter actinomycetemcomitans]KOE69722.1 (p)ppGpp synthetase [Aggregatibacter actinomycetemcomitans serotype f str. D18P1]MBN6060784.1 RelA/SpoT domain-containing protein [Aggregatibacter actinomycetemcomitans]OZV17148.1 (p)ppGpp synthetase [Aggregatibacter actinomycetemcomitans]UEL54417.1 RelA/SpoT domain-containing protein [Aggregatibacter actinomycetemcomitans]